MKKRLALTQVTGPVKRQNRTAVIRPDARPYARKLCYYCGRPAEQQIGDDWVCDDPDCIAAAENLLRIQQE